MLVQRRWFRLILISIIALSVVVADSQETEDGYVWMTDPQTHERYKVLKSTYDRDKAFFVGESSLSNRFSREYLDSLAKQCNATIGPPGFLEFLNHTAIAVAEFCFNPEIYTYSFEIYVRLFETVSWRPYLVASLVAIGFTVARYFFTSFVLKVSLPLRLRYCFVFVQILSTMILPFTEFQVLVTLKIGGVLFFQ